MISDTSNVNSRLSHVETQVATISADVRACTKGIGDLSNQFTAFSKDIAISQKTPWSLYLSALAIVITMGGVYATAIQEPLRKDVAHHESRLQKMERDSFSSFERLVRLEVINEMKKTRE
jgi:hypothetical protein